MLLDAGGDGEDVRIENDVLGREADLIDEDAIRSLADADLVFVSRGLALLVEGHHHRGGAVLFDLRGAFFELRLAFLERDGVHDALALQALQTGLDDLPLRGIDHDGHLVHLRLGLQEDQKLRHHRHAVDEALVHADVDDVCAALDLLTRDGDGFFEFVFLDELREFRRASHVRALADHEVVRAGAQHIRLRAAEAHRVRIGGDLTRRETFHGFRDGGDVRRRVAAAAAHDVHEAAAREILRVASHVRRQQIEARGCQRVRHARIRIRGDEAIRLRGEFFEEGAHLVRAERAIQTDGQRLHMPHGIQIRLRDLPGDHRLATRPDGGTDLHRQLDFIFFKHLADRYERRLRIQRIENGLHEQRIDATGDQGAHLMLIRLLHLIEGDVAEAQIGQIRELRERHRHRADGSGDVAPPSRLLADDVRPFAALTGGLEIDLPREVVEEFVLNDPLEEFRALFALPEEFRLRDARAGKRVCLDDVRTGFEEALVDVLNNIGARDREDVAVVQDVLLVVTEALAACRRLIENALGFVFANRRPHGPVDDQDTLAHGGFEFRAAVGTGGHGRRLRKGREGSTLASTHQDLMRC